MGEMFNSCGVGLFVFPGESLRRFGRWGLLALFDWVCAGWVSDLLPDLWLFGLLASAGRLAIWVGVAVAGYRSVVRLREWVEGLVGPVGVGLNTPSGRRVAVIVDPTVVAAGFGESGMDE